MVPIQTDDLNLVTQSFQRINSAGSIMGEAHMLTALTYREDFDFSECFAEFTDDLPARWSELDEQPFVNILKSLCGFSIYRSDMEKLKHKLDEHPELLARAGKGMQSAADFACRHLNILGPAALPYIYQFVALAYAAANGADINKHAAKLKQWFWITAYTGHFAGMPAGQLRTTFEHLRILCAEEEGPSLLESLPKTCPLVESFRKASVRSLLLMHHLARRQGEGGDQLLAKGNETFILLRKRPASDPENRFLIAPELHVEIREKLFDLTPDHDELRRQHLLPQASDPVWTEFRDSSPRTRSKKSAALDPVLKWRREKWRREQLQNLDRKFIQTLGLEITD